MSNLRETFIITDIVVLMIIMTSKCNRFIERLKWRTKFASKIRLTSLLIELRCWHKIVRINLDDEKRSEIWAVSWCRQRWRLFKTQDSLQNIELNAKSLDDDQRSMLCHWRVSNYSEWFREKRILSALNKMKNASCNVSRHSIHFDAIYVSSYSNRHNLNWYERFRIRHASDNDDDNRCAKRSWDHRDHSSRNNSDQFLCEIMFWIRLLHAS